MAEKFEIEPAVFNESNNIQKYTKNIIDGICKSLYSGNIVFIDVEIPSLGREDRFLVWFVEQLWNQLISRLDQLSNTHCLIRVVGVIAVHSGVPEECLPRYLCYERRAENLDGTRFLEIPLETWTEQEIRNWLINFSGLTAPNIGLSIPEIDAIARSIFEVSNGAPDRAYRELKEQLKDVIQDKFKQYEGNN